MTASIDFQSQAQSIREDFEAAYEKTLKTPVPKEVEDLRIQFLGRKGKVTGLLEKMRDVPKEDRPQAGKTVNELKGRVESCLAELRNAANHWLVEQKLQAPPLDFSLPADEHLLNGSLHPVNLMRQKIIAEFKRLGFTIFDGPEIDFQFYNFSALNTPENHPARDMQDTFYISGQEDLVLRSHTSNVQVHTMLNHRPPIRAVAPGRTFRCDSDLTHTPMFHQVEAFVVDKNISFAHLKGTLNHFLQAIFGKDLKTRFRPSFFPFVEPGAEVDLQCVHCRGEGCRVCSNTGWVEVGGCGMIHPNVFEAVNYDSEEFTGFAFGFGIDRLAMMYYSLTDLRQLFSGDQEFFRQFPIHP